MRLLTSNRIGYLVLFLILLMLNGVVQAKPTWSEWVQQLRGEAIADGINPNLFDRVFATIPEPSRRVLNFDKTQPERRLTFYQYRKTRIDPFRIKLGRNEYRKYSALLQQVGKEYDVDPCFITAIWGLETSYGRFLGQFPVVQALATLAYDSRRADFFKKELMDSLHILNEGHIDLANFKGEWAGASGQPQFMPSSWKKYAVDHDKDGRRDIWRSYADAFASIANYLKKNGWHGGEPWAVEVTLPANFHNDLKGLNIVKPVSEWLQMGVKINSKQVISPNLTASIVQPYGGPNFMAFNNFKALSTYNPSLFYIGSVGYLADQICHRQ